MQKNIQEIKLELLENGKDFILSGIDYLFTEEYMLEGYLSPTEIKLKNYKYGVLHLFSGFLLLLKERLRMHDPELIFKDKVGDKGTKQFTIDLKETLNRLSNELSFKFDSNELEIIKKIQNLRNSFEHYQIVISPYELWSVVNTFLIIIDNFLFKHLDIELESSNQITKDLQDKIHKIGTAWERVITKRKKSWLDDMYIKEEIFEQEKESNIQTLKRNELKYGENSFLTCPECEQETLICRGDFSGICINEDCKEFFPVSTCYYDGEIAIGYDWEENYCDYCKNKIDKLVSDSD